MILRFRLDPIQGVECIDQQLRASDREARTEFERAIELYERKESVFGIERARARLRELER